VVTVVAPGENPKVRISQPTCRHAPRGYVCWPAEPHPHEAHASTHTCEREACVEDAARWVEAYTGHRGEFHRFNQ